MYVLKRPHMDAFMASVGAAYEVVVFTASLAKYADPLLDLLDKGHVVPPPPLWGTCSLMEHMFSSRLGKPADRTAPSHGILTPRASSAHAFFAPLACGGRGGLGRKSVASRWGRGARGRCDGGCSGSRAARTRATT